MSLATTRKLRHRLTIERPPKADDGQGGYVGGWTVVTRTWGEVRPLTQRDTFFASGVHAGATHEIDLHYRRDLTAEQRIVYDGRNFYIKGRPMNVDESNRRMRLRVEEAP